MEKKGASKRRDKRFIVITIIIFAIGFSILLYPFLSNLLNERTMSQVIAEYDESVAQIEPEDYSSYFKEAKDYNRRLYEVGSEIALSYPEVIDGYDDILNVDGKGMIGYVTIPCIGVELPIYHSSDGSVPANAAGHFRGTSFPVGGENTHAVISAHRGLPSARLFTDLDKVEIGDIFKITVLDEELYYKVNQIKTVEPDVTEDVYIEEGKDYCTLLTCTPYGTNTERLLVRGERTDSPEEELEYNNDHVVEILFFAILVAAIILIIVFIYRYRKRNSLKN